VKLQSFRLVQFAEHAQGEGDVFGGAVALDAATAARSLRTAASAARTVRACREWRPLGTGDDGDAARVGVQRPLAPRIEIPFARGFSLSCRRASSAARRPSARAPRSAAVPPLRFINREPAAGDHVQCRLPARISAGRFTRNERSCTGGESFIVKYQ